MLLVAGRCGF